MGVIRKSSWDFLDHTHSLLPLVSHRIASPPSPPSSYTIVTNGSSHFHKRSTLGSRGLSAASQARIAPRRQPLWLASSTAFVSRAWFGNLVVGLERTTMYIGRFRTFSFSPLDLDFALHSQIIIFAIIALAVDVVHPTTIHSFYFRFRTPLLIDYDTTRPVAGST
jgi:hypothetical protein